MNSRSRFFLLTRYSTASKTVITVILLERHPLVVTLAQLRLPSITLLAPPPTHPALYRRTLASPAITTNIPAPTRKVVTTSMRLLRTPRRSVTRRSMRPHLARKVRHRGGRRRKAPRLSHLLLLNRNSTTRAVMALHRTTHLRLTAGTSTRGFRRVLTGNMDSTEATATTNTRHHPLLEVILRATIPLCLTGSRLLMEGLFNRRCSISRVATAEGSALKRQTGNTVHTGRGSIRLDTTVAEHRRNLGGN